MSLSCGPLCAAARHPALLGMLTDCENTAGTKLKFKGVRHLLASGAPTWPALLLRAQGPVWHG